MERVDDYYTAVAPSDTDTGRSRTEAGGTTAEIRCGARRARRRRRRERVVTDRVSLACDGITATVGIGYETVVSRNGGDVRTCEADCGGEGTVVFERVDDDLARGVVGGADNGPDPSINEVATARELVTLHEDDRLTI